MIFFPSRPILLTFIFSVLAYPCLAQDSLINVALRSKPSIVEVQAYRSLNVYKSPESKTAFDPKSGKLLTVTNVFRKEKVQKGAGVILDSDGTIITNLHTIFNTQGIMVQFSDGSAKPAKILKLLPEHDLALLKTESAKPLKAIRFANSNRIHLGEEIIFIGNSFLLKDTISSGRIVGLGKTSDPSSPDSVELIKIKMRLYKGDSGGPVLNQNGDLLGIIDARFFSQKSLSIAIPSNIIKRFYKTAYNNR